MIQNQLLQLETQLNFELNTEGILEAINSAYAVIEFDINGFILGANNNFLATTGYNLTDILSKNH